MHPRKKNHEAAASQQLNPGHVVTYFTTYCRGGKKQQKGGQTKLLELQELEFNLLGITARNCTGISTVKSVTSYLLDGIKATTDDLKKFSILHHHGNDH